MQKKVVLVILTLAGILGYFSLKNVNDENNLELLGTYIDGVYSENIPSKSEGYVVDKIECDNAATGVWDYDKWGLLVSNMSKKSKCNIYFKKGIRLADTITLVDTSGKCPTVNDDGTINVTGAESDNSLLCMAPDDYGTSYYFRGNVSNNYVKFANFYWRIIRINGDGSVRMIYDGTEAHENSDSSSDKLIGKSWFNNSKDDNAYMGYMYGIAGVSTYAETHKNINDSAAKIYIDSWYENNIKETPAEKYLSDNIFCNDRSFAKNNTGTGAGQSVTYYRWGNNLPNDNTDIVLKCLQQNDAFTVNDTTLGNGNLKYKIALPTADEVTLAGAYDGENTSYYLYNQEYNWTMSAALYGKSDTGQSSNVCWHRTFHYSSGLNDFTTYSQAGVKTVINLKAGSLKFGDGTMNNPYKVE